MVCIVIAVTKALCGSLLYSDIQPVPPPVLYWLHNLDVAQDEQLNIDLAG